MHHLIEGVARFRRDVFPAKAELFAGLATRHRPSTLFIGCSDARVPPELITQCEPGELFVVRSAGNLVPAHAPGADAVAAGVEYAVAVLEVRDLVVCGHSGCGAMTALAEEHDLTAVPAVADWLRHADAARSRAGLGTGRAPAPSASDRATLLDRLVRENVRAQLANLATHPSVARAVANGTLTTHGWVYDIATGTVTDLTATGAATDPTAPDTDTDPTAPATPPAAA
ncbi:carbonic anhydrase [Streptomyces sp. PTM05]|uniref:Carbonic anhydrase n=1 Tax=Streptantibioticus parmotrematis TaxID=2873249 RepID=A0ABS7QKT8_9ACTN|nr:carbonic anhydrase [Streptantibioticus parmotrematis]MBY8883563.1 carbonic anhydrase [Streptantibioticus parmotrematis]